MAIKTYQIQGQVIDRKTRQVVKNVRVEAWDKDLLIDDLLGNAVTDTHGHFRIDFDESYYKEIVFDRKPDVFFRVCASNEAPCSQEELLNDIRENMLLNIKSSQPI